MYSQRSTENSLEDSMGQKVIQAFQKAKTQNRDEDLHSLILPGEVKQCTSKQLY